MDSAYDYIAEHAYGDRAQTPTPATAAQSTSEATQTESTSSTNTETPSSPQRQNLQTEFQETFRAFSNSAWGAKLGGFWANARKQGESYYEEARREVEDLGKDAVKEFESVRSKVEEVVVGRGRSGTVKQGDASTDETGNEGGDKEAGKREMGGTSDSNAQDEETETFIARFKTEAAKRLKDVQRAEDAADEALLRFGTNIRNFLRDAVSVTAPAAESQNGEVLFESKDATTGKRVIHTNRFDAQLHVIHTTVTSFTQDPNTDGGQWDEWKKGFDTEKKTEDIARDLEKYTELRTSMEKLVPEQIEYEDFWTRYYFLRHVIEMQEEKRREMLKASAAANEQEEVGWDDDSDEEEEKNNVKKTESTKVTTTMTAEKNSSTTANNDSSSTIHKIADTDDNEAENNSTTLKPPVEGRRSHDEKSVADSEASYDMVSGATSRAPGSPKDTKKADDSDDDWE